MNYKTVDNRIYTDSEAMAFLLLGRLQRLVKPDKDDIHQQLDYGKAKFSELQSLALEHLYDKLLVEIEAMSSHIAELEMSSGTANFVDDDKKSSKPRVKRAK